MVVSVSGLDVFCYCFIVKAISKHVVISQLKAADSFSNRYLAQQVTSAASLYSFQIESADLLQRLCFPYLNGIDFLAPKGWLGGRFHSFDTMAERFVAQNLSFDALADGTALDQEYPAYWFRSCAQIAASFDPAQIGPIVLQPLSFWEHWGCQHGWFRVLDGNHRLLAYAVKLLKDEVSFVPFRCVLVVN